ncbi:MAG: tetratricopeptide repeat protein [Actinomycetes bacterium]
MNGPSEEPAGGRPDAGVAPGGEVYDWYTRGLEMLDGGDAAAAAHLLAHASEAEPDARSIREALARAQFVSRQYAAAADNFGRIVEEIPSDDYARFGLGLSLSRLGEYEAAVEHLALAVAMRPEKKDYVNALRGARATLRAQERQP